MKISKIFAGMSALAVAATMSLAASADEAPVENQFYNATGTWTAEFTGDQLSKAAEDGGAQLSENEDGTYTFGCNIQVGHMKNAKVTMEVSSTKNNIFNGADADATNSTYMWTVQASWNADAPADKEKTPVKFTEDEKKGAVDLKDWDSGPTKYNGQWAQFIMTDNDLSAITIKATIVADDATTWEYHTIDPEAEQNVYEVFRMFGAPNTETTTVDSETINAQIEGTGDASTDGGDSTTDGGDSTADDGSTDGDSTTDDGDTDSDGDGVVDSEDDSDGDGVVDSEDDDADGDGETDEDSDSDGGSSNGGSSNGGSSNGGTSGGSSNSGSSNSGSSNSGSTSGGSSNGGSSNGSGSGTANGTDNSSTGAETMALAGLALAGAAFVVSKKK